MKEFWSENSKTIGKIFLNQFGAAFLGIMIVTAAYASHKPWLMLFASCLSIVFYMYLIYGVLWEKGGQDRIKADGGRLKGNRLTGLYISLCTSIPNFVIAILILVSDPFRNSAAWAAGLNIAGRSLSFLWESMYAGVVAYYSPHNPIIHLLIVFPAIAVGALSYLLGYSNTRLFSVFSLKSSKNDKK